MGDIQTEKRDEQAMRAFMKAVLNDVHALEQMIEADMFETGRRRIGAEQEMFLVDRAMRPCPVATDIIEHLHDPRVTTELARFNIEANTQARLFGGDCLREMEKELHEVVAVVRAAAARHGADVLLTGILPTLRKSDLGLDNMTPLPRYESLNQALTQQRGGDFQISIKGTDELQITHDNVMLESCNTSFQLHFQVAPHEFARLYNVAQAVTAPVLAAAVNSPLFLGQRLWHETRVALFQLSVDERSTTHQSRGFPPRVSFGAGWVRESVLEIFREQIARFRILLAADLEESSLDVLRRGEVPELRALRIHNGTTYRWNRACYGISEGVAHLRIENRVLPAGPTIADEVANAALFFGLMSAFLDAYPEDISRVMEFDDARANFFEAARHGLKAQFHWVGGSIYSASDLLISHLLPMARGGLEKANIDVADADRYIGIIEERVRSGKTGAQWMLRTLGDMGEHATRDIRARSLTAEMLDRQRRSGPAHEWEYGRLREDDDWRRHGYRTVGQFMSTDLFTVHPEDLVDLAANVMDWEHIRHVPVEDDHGHLVGIITHRALLRYMARGGASATDQPVAVRDIMKTAPLTVSPETLTLDAMRMMRRHQIGCLPVVDGDKLVGIITESDLLDVSARLLEKYLSEDG